MQYAIFFRCMGENPSWDIVDLSKSLKRENTKNEMK